MSLISRSRQDRLLKYVLNLNGFFSAFAVALIFFFLLKESMLALNAKSAYVFFDKSWFPTEGQFNLLPMVFGSLAVTIGSVLLALPLGFFSAIFISFYAPKKIEWGFRRVIELYTGIPSVVFGFWGLIKIVPLINEINPPGQSLIAGILVLSLMIFPILTLSLVSSFEMANTKLKKISDSLGLKRYVYIWKILIPSVKGSTAGAILLSTGRAIGETMAVLMVCGNIVKIPDSIFSPVRTLTANIALEMSYAMGEHRSSLFLSGLLLLLIVTVLFFLSSLVNKERIWRS